MCKNTRALMRAFSLLALIPVAVAAVSCTTTVNKVTQDSGNGEGIPGGPRESQPCNPGDETFAIDAFDVTPGEGAGVACDVEKVLDGDDAPMGIAASATKATLVGRDVNGCVGVEFGDGIVLSSLIMKMRPVSGMCGHACTEGGDTGCGTGWKVQIFVGPAFDKLQWLQQLSLTTKDSFEYRVAVHSTYKARYAVICREATPASGDDIAIDVVSGLCGDPSKGG